MSGEGLVLCSICGKPLTDGEPRYRRPDGDVHTACFKGPRVLVVDDDPFLRALVVRAVRRGRFCQVDAVTIGRQALERLRTHVYDLILSDLRMPEMDGPTFYRIMRAEHPGARGPGRVHDFPGRSLRPVHPRHGRSAAEQTVLQGRVGRDSGADDRAGSATDRHHVASNPLGVSCAQPLGPPSGKIVPTPSDLCLKSR